MARNTLEAVFGALGAGLTGYGRERREQQELEEKRRREAMQESLQAANLLASGRFGTEAQLQQSRGRAFETAGQLAASAANVGRMAMGGEGAVRSRIPRMEDVLNVGEAARRGTEPPMFEIGGQRLGVIRTQADEEREKNAMAVQQAAIERDQRLADEETRFERQRALDLELAAARRTPQRDQLVYDPTRGAIVNVSTGKVTVPEGLPDRPQSSSQTTRVGRLALPPLPTTLRDAEELQRMTPNDIKKLSAFNVYNAAQAPLLAGEAKDPITATLAGMGNLLADANERRYANYVGSISDGVARIQETGVLTNQDIARYRAYTLFMPGDDQQTKVRKHENLTKLAGWLIESKQLLAGNPSDEDIAAVRNKFLAILGDDENRQAQGAPVNGQQGYTSADYQAALAALGADASAEDVRAWLRTNRRR